MHCLCAINDLLETGRVAPSKSKRVNPGLLTAGALLLLVFWVAVTFLYTAKQLVEFASGLVTNSP